ncbi:MAG: polysaccharide deacetylase family protein [Anaerolineaceae bacterium]|nr:polysaccharide deacetylase family protein [Anaerolineaceae bacterium]
MKKILITLLVLSVTILASCNIPEKVTEDMARTFVASTMQAKINEIGSLTPPTPTPTETLIPSDTPTPTVTPTPTLAPTPTWIMHDAGSAEILILFYNDIVNSRDDDPYYQWEFDHAGGPYVHSNEFEQQMRILNEMGYTTITLSDMVNVLYNGGELPPRPVMITFDSTELGQWVNAYPIMKKYGMVGNLMLQANHVDAKNSLSSEQIKTMMDDGWEIGSNGYYGNGMADRSAITTEIMQSKPKLEELFGVEITTFSYPDGYLDPEGFMLQRVGAAGYKAALAAYNGTEVTVNRCYYIPRYEILQGMSYNDFFNILPWKEGSISRETMEWTMPTPTLDPAVMAITKQAEETLIALDATLFPVESN